MFTNDSLGEFRRMLPVLTAAPAASREFQHYHNVIISNSITATAAAAPAATSIYRTITSAA